MKTEHTVFLFLRYVYFTDWGTHPKIERADGDGTNRLVLVNSDIVSPRSLAVDLKGIFH
ncbi:Low-density lipoprotein receptor-related protein 5 [Holothuria leucospilota]|uniref:Low-density lipoprotein receptor-related protein 5 n=1 Tax=Holothuria leucospilota TaxID=206669 RepID=A0A9Q1C544_HOLLE|nr:Low-density lipoprotein receptor-related protein 5 [Holothuria leucospilota]